MNKHHHILLIILTLLSSLVVFPHTHPTDSTQVKSKALPSKTVKVPSRTAQVRTYLANLNQTVLALSNQAGASVPGNGGLII